MWEISRALPLPWENHLAQRRAPTKLFTHTNMFTYVFDDNKLRGTDDHKRRQAQAAQDIGKNFVASKHRLAVDQHKKQVLKTFTQDLFHCKTELQRD